MCKPIMGARNCNFRRSIQDQTRAWKKDAAKRAARSCRDCRPIFEGNDYVTRCVRWASDRVDPQMRIQPLPRWRGFVRQNFANKTLRRVRLWRALMWTLSYLRSLLLSKFENGGYEQMVHHLDY